MTSVDSKLRTETGQHFDKSDGPLSWIVLGRQLDKLLQLDSITYFSAKRVWCSIWKTRSKHRYRPLNPNAFQGRAAPLHKVLSIFFTVNWR